MYEKFGAKVTFQLIYMSVHEQGSAKIMGSTTQCLKHKEKEDQKHLTTLKPTCLCSIKNDCE
jgi:hypothetical protein